MNRPVSLQRLLVWVCSCVSAAALALPVVAQEVPSAPPTSPSTIPVSVPQTNADFAPTWVLTLAPIPMWPNARGGTGSFGHLPVSSPLQVLAPQEAGRLFVRSARTNEVGWVHAPSVAPIPEPTAPELTAYLAPPPHEVWWAMPFRPTAAWSSPDADASVVARLRQWLYLRIDGPEENGRVPTFDPRTEARAYVDLDDIGPVGTPPADYTAPPPPDTQAIGLPGRIIGNPTAYDRPERADHFALRRLAANHPVTVHGLVEQGESDHWYRIGQPEYVQATNVRVPRPPDRTFPGRWIDANLTEPVLVTAYEGDQPVYAALAVKGTQTFQTPRGVFRIQRRVANETMDSLTIGIPRAAPGGYYLRDVLYTQYFTGDGAALHYNYWRSDWGYSGSHGCLGMNLDDSRFFWEFGSVGTVVYAHF